MARMRIRLIGFATGFDWALALNRVLRLAGPLSITVGPG